MIRGSESKSTGRQLRRIEWWVFTLKDYDLRGVRVRPSRMTGTSLELGNEVPSSSQLTHSEVPNGAAAPIDEPSMYRSLQLV
jgi:hypothetical protein